MLAKRVVACLDVLGGRVVKGTRFEGLADQGDPAQCAAEYEKQGADEIVVLDVSATKQKRMARARTVRQVASVLSIPLTVGGGIRSLADAETLFQNGADKVSLNTAAVENPALIRQLVDEFGSQSIVVAVDTKRQDRKWIVFTRSGTRQTEWDAVAWAEEAQKLGAGELLVTSIDRDGTREGFDVPLLNAVKKAAGVPVVASGGAGRLQDFHEALKTADAVLAAGVFHSGRFTIRQVKQYLKAKKVTVRT